MANDNQAVQDIQDSIAQAAQHSGRKAEDITLVAVSKTKPIEDIITAYEAGVRHFGENRSEELTEKAEALSHLTDLKWHFIGHLQSRQSQPISQYAHYFHTVDRTKIAKTLSAQLVELKRDLPVFIQVNVSGEESKGGFACENWATDSQQVDELVNSIKEIDALPNIEVLGLMTMAPFNVPEETLRPIFKNLAGLSARLQEKLPEMSAQQLSMGMSGDFEIAIEEGATLVRIGSAIFGQRTKKP